MSSKKHRIKLKAQYNSKKVYKPSNDFEKKLLHDMETALSYLKEKPNKYVKSNELMKNCDLHYSDKTAISMIIKKIIQYYNAPITTKAGRNGGYMYYEQQ